MVARDVSLIGKAYVVDKHEYFVWLQVGGASGKEPAHQCKRRKRHEFDPWVGKIPWRRAWLEKKKIALAIPGSCVFLYKL